jgi:hypothetical protein
MIKIMSSDRQSLYNAYEFQTQVGIRMWGRNLPKPETPWFNDHVLWSHPTLYLN